MAAETQYQRTGTWNKAEQAFIEVETRRWIYLWAQLHISESALGNRFQVVQEPESGPYREYAISKKWLSTEGYLLASGLMIASRVAKS